MPGQFSKANRPRRPGGYVTFDATQPVSVQPSVGSIVAIPFTHDWGPFEVAQQVASLAEFQALYGYSTQTPGYIAVKQAFQGEGLSGRGGAGAVLCYRFGGSAALKATRTLQNTTPAVALTMTALYEGTRANSLRATTQDHAADAAKNELIILDGTVEVERYVYTDIDIADLAAQINARSNWVTAVANITGVALGVVAAQAFAGGNDGSTLASGDWTAMESAMEVERFGIFSPFDLTGAPDVAALKVWAANLNVAGKRFEVVLGGVLDEAVATAITAAALLNDENFMRVGNGSVSDAGMLDANDNPTILSTSQLAPRIAGILAQKGEAKSMTFSRLAGLTLLNGPTDAGVLQAFDGGVVLLTRDSNADAPVRIERGLTTFLSPAGTVTKPYSIFRNPKFVRTMQGVQMDLQDWSETNVIGLLPVNNKTRDYVLGHVKSMLAAREDASVILAGWSVSVDPDPPPLDTDEFIAVVIGLRFGRSAEQVFFTIKVG